MTLGRLALSLVLPLLPVALVVVWVLQRQLPVYLPMAPVSSCGVVVPVVASTTVALAVLAVSLPVEPVGAAALAVA